MPNHVIHLLSKCEQIQVILLRALLLPFPLHGGSVRLALRKLPGAKGCTNENRVRTLDDRAQFAVRSRVGRNFLPYGVAHFLEPSLQVCSISLRKTGPDEREVPQLLAKLVGCR